jgi:hypothetical protein
MKSEIKRELILTLNEKEIVELRDFMVNCRIWMDGEMMSDYWNTVVSELWEILNK